PLDKRSRLLSISPAGSELLREISDRYVDMLSDTLKDWSDEDVGRLTELLARLHNSFGDCRSRGGRQLPEAPTSRTPA
ncbi:MarR family transcriptional regulator, partial [Streptomyces sp. NPDC048845]